MNIEEALKVGEMKNATVIAGREGKTREINAVEVMEVPDISEWLTEGILLVTTFYSIRNSPEKQIDVFKALIRAKGAGLVIKIGRYIHQLPEEIYELADEYSLPVISIPVETSFVKILTDLFEKIYEEKSIGEQRHYQLLSSMFGKDNIDLNQAMEAISNYTSSPVFLEDAKFRLLAHSEKVVKDDWRTKFILLTREKLTPLHEALKKKIADGATIVFFNEKPLHPRLILPIYHEHHLLAYLHILTEDTKLLKQEYESVFLQICEQIKLILTRNQSALQFRKAKEYEFFHSILEQAVSIEVMTKQARVLHIDLNKKHGFFVINFHDYLEMFESTDHMIDIRNIAYQHAYKIIELYLDHYLSFYRHGNLFVFFSVTDKELPNMITIIEKITEQLSNKLSFPFFTGISYIHSDLSDLKIAFKEASFALQIGKDVKGKKQVAIYEDLGVYRYLMKLKDDEELLEYTTSLLNPLLQHDADQHQRHLYKTLKAFLQENGNQKRTAETLFIHRRTLKYRLDKMEEMMNVDLQDSDTRLLIGIAMKLYDLNNP